VIDLDLSYVFLEATNDGWAGRLFALDAQTLIQIGFMFLNVSLLAVLLTSILYTPVREILAKRSARIAEQLSSAEENMAGAKRLREEYEAKIANIEAEKSDILATAQKQANERSQKVVSDAKETARSILERAQNDAQAEMDNVKEEVRRHIIEVSGLLAGKFVEAAIDGGMQEKLFDEAITELGRATWPN
jgi:F-type H+-transporting ATPase subunit b